jgi:uncharacterized membrane protein
MIAAIYAALTLALAPISYSALQVRVAEALTVLPFISRLSIPGLFVGCLVANLFGLFFTGLGWYDVVFGSLATLLAAYLTSRVPRPILAPLPPIVINALVVAAYVSALSNLPYWLTALYIAAGEAVAGYVLGYPLLIFLLKRPALRRYIE